MKPVKVSFVPAFDDNYIWFIHGVAEKQATNKIIIVDPGDEDPVIEAISDKGFDPQGIFITHHHGDHTGGVNALVKKYDIPVYGPAHEHIPAITTRLTEGQVVSLDAMGLQFRIIDVPGHTRGHIAYYGHKVLFIGDTLFAGGCGRLFEGTAVQMHNSLSKLFELPDDTLVYCAHEYTQENLVFAKRVEPENEMLSQRIADTDALRSQFKPTVPSSLQLEKQTNPFLRFNQPNVITAAEQFSGKTSSSPADVFRIVRHWKDTLD